jgi:hypothetical protein
MKTRILLNVLICTFCIFLSYTLSAQELYVMTDPASTMPARSIILKQSYQQMGGNMKSTFYNTQLEFSWKKNWMMHIGTNYTASDVYLQYRFYSYDDIHAHTRLAFFAKAINSPYNPTTNAIMMEGQQKLWNAGFIATRLQHKWASSITAGWLHRYTGIANYGKNGIQYSWSNGWLLYPKNYSNYQQTNINFYVELLGQQVFNDKVSFLDMAPAIQLIFNSQAKVNLGYRWALMDNTNRMSKESVYLSFDYLFFNALPKRKNNKK